MTSTPDVEMLDRQFIAQQRRRLRRDRAEQLRIVDALAAEVAGHLERRYAGEPSEEGFGRGGGESVELDQARWRHESALAGLADIDEAMARLDTVAYGRCDECGQPIGRARLEAIPTATRRVGCAATRPGPHRR